MSDNQITSDQITDAEIIRHARTLSALLGAEGLDSTPHHAMGIARAIAKSHDDNGDAISLAPVVLWCALGMMYNRLYALAMAVDDVRQKIDDAATCYADPDLSNDGYDGMPQWVREMIVAEKT